MANIKSAAKRSRQNLKREQRNKHIKSALKTAIRRFEEALQNNDAENARLKYNEAICQIDKAAAKGVVHKNNAARKKSRLSRMFNNQQAV